MSNPRIEEVTDSDSDPDVMDIDEAGPLMVPAQPRAAPSSLMNASQIPTMAAQAPQRQAFDASHTKRWICLYPIYFDARRSHKEGRRVHQELAVKNPQARTIADAVASLGLRVFFDLGKIHPKDWSNPGRVRVELKDEDGNLKRSNVKNKHHLFIHVGKYLQSHPATAEDALNLPIRGMNIPKEPPPPPAMPRGWKMGDILPIHSPAVTGGGVSDNLLKDMMGEMGGAPAGPTGNAVSKKKDKKKGK